MCHIQSFASQSPYGKAVKQKKTRIATKPHCPEKAWRLDGEALQVA
jgi:hypothetical protein